MQLTNLNACSSKSLSLSSHRGWNQRGYHYSVIPLGATCRYQPHHQVHSLHMLRLNALCRLHAIETEMNLVFTWAKTTLQPKICSIWKNKPSKSNFSFIIFWVFFTIPECIHTGPCQTLSACRAECSNLHSSKKDSSTKFNVFWLTICMLSLCPTYFTLKEPSYKA